MEDLLATQISAFVSDQGKRLRHATSLQADLFRKDKIRLDTPKQANETLSTMLILLNHMRDVAVDFFYYTYPEGLFFGYKYDDDGLKMWTQVNLTIYTWKCTPDGTPLFPPISGNEDVGNRTIASPGNNNTLQNDIGGTTGANLDYSNDTAQSHTDVFIWDKALYKTTYDIGVNPVTKQKVVFGNDWTMEFVSKQLTQIMAQVPYPTFCAIIEISTGHVVSTSTANLTYLSSDALNILAYDEIESPFLKDFASYLDQEYKASSKQGKLKNLQNRLDTEFAKSTDNLYVNRPLFNEVWKAEMKTLDFDGEKLLFVLYLNMDAVESKISRMSTQTGFILLGIIIGFIVLGTLFSLTISRQLGLVSKQIGLLMQLKFSEVLDKQSGIKGRSFVYELAGLQESFHEMAPSASSTGFYKPRPTSAAPDNVVRP
ncbi:hypothetical protein BDR26DRAFT_861500, partial [Obelidium mucronatum]